ncbi:MAG TPA: MFS transporter [Bacillota bacterium]|nr:MFS transporter [Bacillota bacterium]
MFQRLRAAQNQSRWYHLYMLFLSLQFSIAFWVIFLRSRGISFAAIGLLETIFHIAAFSAEIPTGIIADRLGRRASLMLGRTASIIASVLTIVTRNIVFLALAFALDAIAGAFHSGAFEAMVYDHMRKDQKESDFTKRLGGLNSISLLGGAAAALTGGWVAQYSLIFLYVLNISADLLAIGTLLMFKEVKQVHDGTASNNFSILRQAYDFCLKNPGIIRIYLLSGFIGAAVYSCLFYGQSYLKSAGIPFTLLGTLSMLTGLASFLPARFSYRVEAWFGWRRSLRIALVFIGGIILGLGLIPQKGGLLWQTALFIGFLLYNAGYESLYPLISNQLNMRIPQEQRATLLSANGMAYSIFMMAIFPLFGVIGDRVGLKWGYIGLGILILLLAAGLIGRRIKKP